MYCRSLWIGAKDVNGDNTVIWINANIPVSSDMWQNPAGPNQGQGDCVYLNANVHKLRLHTCSTGSLHFICELDHSIY